MAYWRSTLRKLALLLGLLAASPVLGQTAVQPKIVIQTLPGSIDVAAWSPDERYLVTASGVTREFIIWDVSRRLIIDRLRLPGAANAIGADLMRLTTMTVSADGRSAMIAGLVTDTETESRVAGRVYRIDLATRAITTERTAAPAGAKLEDVQGWYIAIGVLASDEDSPEMSLEQARALLPQLPVSPSGRYTLRRTDKGFEFVDQGRALPFATAAMPADVASAALAPDGRRIAFIRTAEDQVNTTIEIFDTLTARYGTPVTLEGDYQSVVWLNEREFLAHGNESYSTESDEDTAKTPLPPLAIVDGTSGQLIKTIEARCFPVSLGEGVFIGAGIGNCRAPLSQDRGLSVFNPTDGKWEAIPDLGLKADDTITVVTAHQASGRVAFAVTHADTSGAIYAVDTGEGNLDIGRGVDRGGIVTQLSFTNDGQNLFIGSNGVVTEWDLAKNSLRPLAGGALMPSFFASDGRNVLFAGLLQDGIGRVDLARNQALPPLELGNAMSGGFLPNRPIFWAASGLGSLKLWDTRDWSPLLTTYLFNGSKFVAVTQDGRYDTNLGPDADQFRWLVSDAPFQSLPAQVFMRDYFEPRLTQRLTDCTTARNCDQVLKPIPSIAKLNRALPVARITGVEPGEQPGTVEVQFELREGTANGKRSGVYNPRLFLNNRFASHTPDKPFTETETPEQWREVNRLPKQAEEGVYRYNFVEPIPTGGPDKLTFSVYAFNEDRVKGDTATFTYVRPPIVKRKPRAFVLTIGVDAYDEPRLELNYAVADARLIANRLAVIPGYEMHHAMLAGAKRPDGSRQPVTRKIIDSALGILAGMERGPKIQELAEAGIDASALDKATPDDIVIVSFSGHGWADPRGNFYLVPSDGKWADGEGTPDTSSLVSAATLTMWLRAIDAAEIAFIIDACHSGASVDSGSFKPGPMGDSGLGQLAFDKGIRILAATQAKEVARENGQLGQGLLTAALGKGLTPQGGPADLNSDRRITLDEWLRYAVQELPRLANAGGTARGFTITQRPTAAASKAAVQEPALFDFTNAASPVILRGTR